MRPTRLAALLLAAASLTPALAQRAAPHAALPPVAGEVIVRFKPEASVLRRAVMPARVQPEGAAAVLAQRARLLGERAGRGLQAGAALGERTQVVRAEGMDAASLARQLAADGDVEFAEPNGRRRILNFGGSLFPNDPLYGPSAALVRSNGLGAPAGTQNGPRVGQWYLRAPTAAAATGPDDVVSSIDIESAWTRTTGSANVVVAVLDTGVLFDHPDLGRAAAGGKLLPGYDFVSDSVVANDGSGRDGDPTDPGDWLTSTEAATSRFTNCEVSNSSWHGTGTSSLIGAATHNGIGMAGAAPGVRVLPVRVLGKCFGTDADIQAGMRWAAGIAVAGVPANPTPARVLNMSLGASGPCTAGYQSAVDDVLATGAVIVAAAGNSAGGPVGAPGNCRGVIAVLALRHAGTKVGFSDLGPEISIAAPGGNCVDIGPGDACRFPILAATNSGAQVPVASVFSDSFDITLGTSFSSPLVAATAALVLSHRPNLDGPLLMSALATGARPFPTTGADNGTDPTPVAACVAPSAGVDQLQCYCTGSLCGVGMLDAGRALAAAEGTLARIVGVPARAAVGTPLQLLSEGSPAAPGRSIVAWRWELVDGGGVASAFSGGTTASTASLVPLRTGTVRVRLTVTDSAGQTGTVVQAFGVGDPVPASGGGGGGGGGAMGWGWLLLLALAIAGLRQSSRGPAARG